MSCAHCLRASERSSRPPHERSGGRSYPGNVGQTWTTQEEKELVTAFKSGDSPVDIAQKHGRTLRAIEARLEKLGLITAEQRTTRGGFTGPG